MGGGVIMEMCKETLSWKNQSERGVCVWKCARVHLNNVEAFISCFEGFSWIMKPCRSPSLKYRQTCMVPFYLMLKATHTSLTSQWGSCSVTWQKLNHSHFHCTPLMARLGLHFESISVARFDFIYLCKPTGPDGMLQSVHSVGSGVFVSTSL